MDELNLISGTLQKKKDDKPKKINPKQVFKGYKKPPKKIKKKVKKIVKKKY